MNFLTFIISAEIFSFVLVFGDPFISLRLPTVAVPDACGRRGGEGGRRGTAGRGERTTKATVKPRGGHRLPPKRASFGPSDLQMRGIATRKVAIIGFWTPAPRKSVPQRQDSTTMGAYLPVLVKQSGKLGPKGAQFLHPLMAGWRNDGLVGGIDSGLPVCQGAGGEAKPRRVYT